MKIYTLYLFVLLLAASCGSQDESAAEENTDSMAPLSATETLVKTSAEPTENEESSIQLTGYIDVPPANRAAISPYYGGFAARIAVLPGQQVRKGDILLVLRNPAYLEMQQDYLEAYEQLDYLKGEAVRQKQLANEKIASEKVMMKAESDYRQMLARANAMGEKLLMLNYSLESIRIGKLSNSVTLRAPFDGTVTALNVKNGQFVDAKEIALELINTEHIHLELEAFEKDAIWIEEGQAFDFRIPELSTEIFKGDIYLVNKSVNLEKRTVKIHGHIENEKAANFLPGMFVEAELKITK